MGSTKERISMNRLLRPRVILADDHRMVAEGLKTLLATEFELVALVADRRALDAGASGFVLKHSAPAELIAAIRAALQGKTYVTPVLAGEVLHEIQRDPRSAKDPVASLTVRQREILKLLVEGNSAK